MLDRLKRRIFPLLASIGLLLVGMFTTTLGPTWTGKAEWALPYDLWGTLIATVRLVHGNVGGLYTQPTGLVSLPGAAVILLPCAAVIAAAGLSLQIPGPHNLHPPVWLLAGPYEIALCCVTLFAADALAEQLGVTKWKRGLLSAASAVALWNVSARWGHPEDAVAVGLLLYAVLALSRSRTAQAGWLAGAAVCVQPLVLLALPMLLAPLPWRRMPAFLVRSALPSAVLLGAAALANWHATYTSVTSQPNSPVINHPTAWTSLAPHMSNTNVAAGPARLATIVLACCCALAVRRRWLAQAETAEGGVVAAVTAGRRALVGGARAGAAVVLRAGDGVLLPVAGAGRGADPRRDAPLDPAGGRLRRRGRPDRGGPGPVAQRLGLVGPAGRRPRRHARPVQASRRPCRRPERRTHPDGEPRADGEPGGRLGVGSQGRGYRLEAGALGGEAVA